MAFLAPLIVVGGFGLAAGSTAAIIGTALVGAAISVGVGYAAQRLMGTPSAPNVGLSGTQLSLNMDPNSPRGIPVGKTALAGDLKYWQLSGTDNEITEMVTVLGDWPCNALVGLFVNGKRVTLNSDGTVVEFPNVLKITFHNGDFDQLADAQLVANSDGHIGNNDRAAGVCYVKIWRKNDPVLFPGGQPRYLFEIEGAKLYDWRKDDTVGGVGGHRWNDVTTWEYSDNPAVVAFNWRRGFWHGGDHFTGMQTPVGALDLDSYTIAANICDELVPLASGGTEKRYRIGGLLKDNAERRTVLAEILKVMGGEEIESGGFYTLYAGAARSVVMTLSDDDLMIGEDFTWTGTKSGNDQINAVFGAWRDPDAGYQESALPPRIGVSEVLADGQRHDVRYNYELGTSATQCQRLMEQARREARFQGELQATFRARASLLQPGDWITLSVKSRGWVDRLFVVMSGATLPDHQASLVLHDVGASIWNWDSTQELAADAPGQINTQVVLTDSISGLLVETFLSQQTSGSARRPGLRVSWTPIADLTVDAVLFEYRIKGSGQAVLERRAENPAAGQYAWLDGIQGQVRYEVRAKLRSTPRRSMQWSLWVEPPIDTAEQVVDLGATTIEITPGSVGSTELDAQSNYEIGLSAEVAQGLGPAWEIQSWDGMLALMQDHLGWEAHKRDDDNLTVQTNTARAEIRIESDVRADENTAIATQLQAVESSVGTNTSSLTDVTQSVDGINSTRTISVNQNGEVLGSFEIGGANGIGYITFLSELFKIAAEEGGLAVPIFLIDATDPLNKKAILNVDEFIVDGAIKASHINAATVNALMAKIDELTSLLIKSEDGKSYWDLTTGDFVLGAVTPI